jgi:hypothetical protein
MEGAPKLKCLIEMQVKSRWGQLAPSRLRAWRAPAAVDLNLRHGPLFNGYQWARGGWGGASGSSSVSQVSGDRDSGSLAMPAALDLGAGLTRPVLASDAAPTRPEPGGAMPPPGPARRQAGDCDCDLPSKVGQAKGGAARQVGIGEKWFSLLAGAHLGSTLGVKSRCADPCQAHMSPKYGITTRGKGIGSRCP